MKNRLFILYSFLVMLFGAVTASGQADKPNELYELRVYELTRGASLSNLENYFTNAFIPAANRLGIKNVGVFRETGKSEPVKVYLLIPYPSFNDYLRIRSALQNDAAFRKAAEAYNGLPPDKKVYERFESSFMLAFDGQPKMVVPESKPRIFELRTYQGYSEDAVRRKVSMFNGGEFEIFNRTGLHPVFFGEVIAGKDLPCLTYMITFRDMDEREANWKAFGADPAWQKMLKDPQYADTVSKIIRVFLEPMACSQI